ncbi:hypothetical protein F5984_16665 [Rudanella paleaurantiibacter]|uniref:DUF4276 family protein n=1 Tax=Rudanella paleaurantiibacter TaxID=2614655 RepID=A0A7J5TX96_9BACT|nr:hypothetical protein [Rudanella paleaurantiibacter]KAB7729265.1 hypothetical protein F5984_16665 [Rudanella paleaurantiibacter]
MSQIVTYAFFGEDDAQRNFLEKYLHQEFPDTFIEDENERWRFKATNDKQVDKLLPEALRQIRLLELDVLFISRDIDTDQTPKILEKQADFSKTCQGHPAIVMLPVQCIEYWLWYIKRHHEEPGKNTPLESQTRATAKRAVYDNTKVVAKQIALANDILLHLDVNWLTTRSPSFNHFHKQVQAFLSEYAKT